MWPWILQVSPVNIHRVTKLLAYVEQNIGEDGSVHSHSLFSVDKLYDSALIDCRNAVVALQTVKSISRTLADISSLVQDAISELSRELMPTIHRSGMASLPDELLAQIFESAFDLAGEDRNSFTNVITSVCHRYRKIALKLPKLWTAIKVKSGPSDLPNLHLILSRGRGLAVEIDTSNEAFLHILPSIHQIRPSLERWEELKIRAFDKSDCATLLLRYLRQAFSETCFPALKALRLEYWDAGHYLEEPERLEEDELKLFFEDWHLPALRRLDISNYIPERFDGAASRITCLNITLGPFVVCHDSNFERTARCVNDILRFLYDLPSLEELSFKLSQVLLERGSVTDLNEEDDSDTDDDDAVGMGDAILKFGFPTIRKLSFDIQHCSLETFFSLTSDLKCPNLREMNLRLGKSLTPTPYSEDLWGWLLAFSRPNNLEDSKVSHISLSIDDVYGEKMSNIEYFLEDFAALRYLKIKGRSVSLPTHALENPLDTLRIEDSYRVDREFLEAIRMTSLVNEGKVQHVELVDCPGVDEQAFRDRLFVGTDLVWRTGLKTTLIHGRDPELTQERSKRNALLNSV